MSLTSITLGVIMKLWILFILSFSAKAKRLEIFINYILWYEHVTWPYKKMSSGQVISARFNDAGYLDWRLVRRGVSPNMQPQWISLRFGHTVHVKFQLLKLKQYFRYHLKQFITICMLVTLTSIILTIKTSGVFHVKFIAKIPKVFWDIIQKPLACQTQWPSDL